MIMTCQYHPYRPAIKQLISWISTSRIHAYRVNHGLRCRECIEEALQRFPENLEAAPIPICPVEADTAN